MKTIGIMNGNNLENIDIEFFLNENLDFLMESDIKKIYDIIYNAKHRKKLDKKQQLEQDIILAEARRELNIQMQETISKYEIEEMKEKLKQLK